MLAVETHPLGIYFLCIRLAEHITEVFGRAAQDIGIFKVFQQRRHQLDSFVGMGAAEVYIVIDNGSPLTGQLQEAFYLIAEHRCNGKIGTYHHNVVRLYIGHLHLQTLVRIVLVEKILRIVPFVQESQRYRRFTVRKYVYTVGTYSVVPHILQNDPSYPVVPGFADKGDIYPHPSQRNHGIINGSSGYSCLWLVVPEQDVEDGFADTDYFSIHRLILIRCIIYSVHASVLPDSLHDGACCILRW